jgi:hypothetical protein
VWHAPAAALRCLIVTALTVIAAATAPAMPRAITIEVARPAAANACPDTFRKARYPMTANATITDVDGA